MKVDTFVPCRLGEPITSVALSKTSLYFGSISGYIGKFDTQTKQQEYYPHCMTELIRDLCFDDDKLYACVGDQYIAVHKASDLSKLEDLGYDEFKHKDLLCGNYFSFIKKSQKTTKMTAF